MHGTTNIKKPFSLLHSDTCIHSCEFLQLYFHFSHRIISINYKTDRGESFLRNCDSVTSSGNFSPTLKHEYSFLRLQEPDDEHHSTNPQAIPRFLKYYLMYVSVTWNCHPQATSVCCRRHTGTHREEPQAGSFCRNPTHRRAMLSRNEHNVAQNASVTEYVTTNGFIVQIKLPRRCQMLFLIEYN
jgi:hypothetical protein